MAMRFPRRQLYPKGHKEIAFPRRKGKSAPNSKGSPMEKRTSRFFLVPCHRVIKSNGEIGGFASGTKNKIKLLKKEMVKIEKGKIDLSKYSYNFVPCIVT